MTQTTLRPLSDIALLKPQAAAFAATPAEVRGASIALPDDRAVDWPTIVAMRRRVSDDVTRATEEHAARLGAPMPDADRRLMARSIIKRVVREHAEEQSLMGELWTIEREQAYATALENSIFGYGRLQPLFELEDVENIEIHGFDSVIAQYGDGRRVPLPPVADSDEELVEAIPFLGESVQPPRPFDDAHPTMTLALGDRHRLHAVGFGLSYRGRLRNCLPPCQVPQFGE